MSVHYQLGHCAMHVGRCWQLKAMELFAAWSLWRSHCCCYAWKTSMNALPAAHQCWMHRCVIWKQPNTYTVGVFKLGRLEEGPPQEKWTAVVNACSYTIFVLFPTHPACVLSNRTRVSSFM